MIDVNEEIHFENIDEMDKYLSTDKFDFIKIAEDYNPSNDRRFWGSQFSQGPCVNGSAEVYYDYYVFGIRVQHQLQGSLGGGPLTEPCGMH